MIKPSTFSIIGYDPHANETGVVVQSKFLSVGAAVPWVAADAGAVATQAWANTTYGPRGLEMLRKGMPPQDVIAELIRDDEHASQRQLGIVDMQGRSATYTGDECMPWAGGKSGTNFAAQGNILAGPEVVDALVSTFEQTRGALADRLVAALRAGQAAGGDRRGKQSAALYIAKPKGGYSGFNDRYVDLRVDDHPEPIEELARILELHKLYFFKPEPQDVLKIDTALGAEIVTLLKRAKALASTSAAFDVAANEALVKFMHKENLEDRVRDDGCIDRQTLGYLRGYTA
ncbi:MAG TPA: DUF1028 domain-containing protein [Candidatus Tumulicola sp.]|nr:DUF1028 domain-containing protein [Candidatus Tumulicola sp.]